MRRLVTKRFFKYLLLGGAGVGTILSLRTNKYQVDSIGIVRLSRAFITVSGIGITYKTNLYKHGLDKSSQEYKDLKSYCHQLAAEQLLKLCCSNKGVYIKVGQHLAALDYILPKEYVQTMKVLHSHAPPNTIEDVYKVLREDLKDDVENLFKEFDVEPLGTASLAQVHRAVLKDGSVVAVKVQHPYIRGNAVVDMKTMEILVKIMSWIFPEFKFQWLVEETKKNIPQELDFVQEGKNAEKLIKIFHNVDWLKVPKVRWELSTSRVLVMDFVDGGQVNDLKYIQEHDINPFEVSDKLGQLYSQMIFMNGFVHSDPHPGNILVKKSDSGGCDIILLDHGLYANLKDEFRVEYAKLWLSILDRDRTAMRYHCKNLGIDGNLYGLFACMVTGRSWESIMEGINKKTISASEQDFVKNEFPSVLSLISDVLDQVNRQMLLVLKTNDLMRGIESTLKTGHRQGAFRVMSNCCIRSVYSQKIEKASDRISKLKYALYQYWTLFKLNIYYTFLIISHKSKEIVGLTCG